MASKVSEVATDVRDAVVTTVAEIKPRLRGWLHQHAAFVSIAMGATLVAVSAAQKGGGAAAATAVYAATITMLFGTSALYHRVNWSPSTKRLWKRLDHSMIFVFIAGTYTPMAVMALPHTPSIVVLAIVWSGAAVGVGLQLFWPSHPRWLSAPCYLALGWVAVFVVPDILHNAGVAALVLIIVGGLVYTLGAIVYALKRPNPFPATFGFHEIFHACTLVAAACHYIAIWLCVFH
jgi:hemolysin III